MDMDDEGVDAHFLVPTLWVSVVGLSDVELEVGLIRAYHRHIADFCGQAPARLKTAIVVSTRAVDEAVREIKQWGTSKWAVAVLPAVAKDVPVDHPDLEPDLAGRRRNTICRSSITASPGTPPYFPGYQDLWDNIFLGRLAVPSLGRACGSSAAFIGAGIFDRYRACEWACSNAASAGCRSGPGAWTSRRSTSAAPRALEADSPAST